MYGTAMFERLIAVPGIRQIYARRLEKGFRGAWAGTCHGVYPNFAAAGQAAPKTKPLGYDNAGPAQMYEERLNRLVPSDYPAMFWLNKLFSEGARRVYDFGGHIGVAYYAYQHYFDFPKDVSWTVYDVPAVVEAGRELAKKRGAPEALSFTSEVSDASGADIFLAAGSLQYVESPTLGEMLDSLPSKPKFVLVNKTPLTQRETFVTLQNIGTAYCPYILFNEETFKAPLLAGGYKVRDRWENADHTCELPLNPEHTLRRYTGLLFER